MKNISTVFVFHLLVLNSLLLASPEGENAYHIYLESLINPFCTIFEPSRGVLDGEHWRLEPLSTRDASANNILNAFP